MNNQIKQLISLPYQEGERGNLLIQSIKFLSLGKWRKAWIFEETERLQDLIIDSNAESSGIWNSISLIFNLKRTDQ